jgi:Tfp pilus assembly protein PilF
VDRSPASKEIRYHLGMAELRAGQTERARSDLEAAVAGSVKYFGSEEARTALASLKGRAG